MSASIAAQVGLAADPPPPERSPSQDEPARPNRSTVRFTWQADPAARFIAVSPNLGDIVGSESAAIVGRTWEEVASDCVVDPSGAIAGLFAGRETWSGRLVHWRIDRGEHALAVDLAGMPIFGPDRQLVGFRGFGLCRTDTVVPWPRPDLYGVLTPSEADLGRPVDDAVPSGSEPSQFDGGLKAAAVLSEQADLADRLPRDDQPSPEDAAADEQPNPPVQQASTPPPIAITDSPPDGSSPLRDVDPVATLQQTPLTSSNEAAMGRLGQDRPAPLHAVEGSLSLNPAVPNDALSVDHEAVRRGAEPKPRLSVAERSAFREIARALGARFEDDDTLETSHEPRRSAEIVPAQRGADAAPEPIGILDRLPLGILVHRGERPIFANRLLLDWIDYSDIKSLAADGGVARLFRGRLHGITHSEEKTPLALSTRQGGTFAVEAQLTTVEWGNAPAGLMLIRKLPEVDPIQRLRALELDLKAREAQVQELSAILDTATDGVLVLDEAGRILALNRSAEALFGYDQREVTGEPVTVLLAPESHAMALDYLAGLQANGMASLLNDGREVLGRVRQGGTIPLFMTMGRVNEEPERKFCSVLRDITAYKKAEGELHAAKHAVGRVNAQTSDFLAKMSHEIRTPLNAIIGFAEVMLEERFGPMGNERYKDYLKDVHSSGRRVIHLADNLLHLVKIEAGQVELSFTGINLNALVAKCIATMQSQSARERIVMRTSFAPQQPSIVADEHSVRQIVTNIVSNAIRFTDAGGQVIVSTAVTDRGEVALRVRDTGIGMTGGEIEAALKPFGQLATARRGDGAGLGLPLTKALVAANRGALQITSVPNEGTLVEVLFPLTQVLAEDRSRPGRSG